jgi:hypothetical protein
VLNPDQLKITYVIVQGDDKLDEMSPFQGFGESWPPTLWALRLLAFAPASLIERSLPIDGLIAQRMGGMNRLIWLPLWIGALEQTALDDFGFIMVAFTGDDNVATRVNAWCEKQPRLVLHVRAGEIGSDEEAIAFCDTSLRDHCRTVLDTHGNILSALRLEAARRGIEGWLKRERITDADAPGGHNITIPNQMVLLRADRRLPRQEPFMGNSEEDYDAHAIASAQSVLDLRQANGLREFNRLYLPQPGLVLTEPALYRSSYGRMRREPSFTTKPMLDALRRLQKQTGLWSTMDGKDVIAFLEDPKARILVAARQAELATHSHGVGLMAAQTCSAVLRLRPGVNHVFPVLSRYAANIRSRSHAARFKTPRLFEDIQRELVKAVGQARIEFIACYKGTIKIVADAPIELLPIGNLPVGLRYDCSRINATPGSLMMGELVGHQPMTLDLSELRRVLVVSAFADNDRLRNIMSRSLDSIAPDLVGRVEVTFVRVRTRADLVRALNASDATILIFDGHGVTGDEDGVGGIEVNGKKLDVWQLRGEARIPPIVVLSACDTHGIDAPTHATAGNGFLAAGAVTVLATLLPIGGIEGALFIRRLLLRLAYYLPAVLGQKQRVYNWCEVVAGLLRMVLGTDMVDSIVKDENLAIELKTRANFHINTGNPDWYNAIVADIAEATGMDLATVERRTRDIMARSEAVRYVQFGWPESIMVDDGGISGQFFPSGTREALGVD